MAKCRSRSATPRIATPYLGHWAQRHWRLLRRRRSLSCRVRRSCRRRKASLCYRCGRCADARRLEPFQLAILDAAASKALLRNVVLRKLWHCLSPYLLDFLEVVFLEVVTSSAATAAGSFSESSASD